MWGSAPVMIYSLAGTGSSISTTILDTSQDFNSYSNPMVAIFSGDCKSTECVNSNYGSYNGYVNVDWQSKVGVTYFLVVYSCCGYQSTMEFELTVKPEPVINLCTDSKPLILPTTNSTILCRIASQPVNLLQY